jgi:GT2 family glycosyltransferase
MNSAVTWLLPVKNGQPYLLKTLESIARQSYTDSSVMAWDNGSEDGTVELLQSWIPSRLPGQVVTGRPLTLGECLAEMVRMADTRLCARIDADDLCLEKRLASQIDFLEAHPEAAVVGGQVELIDANGAKLSTELRLPQSHADIVCTLLSKCPFIHPSVMFRREAVLAVGNYRDLPDWRGANIEDYDLWSRLAAAGHTLRNLPDLLLSYRVHEKSSTQRSLQTNRLASAKISCFAENAPKLFGMSSSAALKLQQRRLFCAIPLIRQISHYLRVKYGFEPHQSRAFFRCLKDLLPTRDLLAWAYLVSVDPEAKPWLQEIQSLLYGLFVRGTRI